MKLTLIALLSVFSLSSFATLTLGFSGDSSNRWSKDGLRVSNISVNQFINSNKYLVRVRGKLVADGVIYSAECMIESNSLDTAMTTYKVIKDLHASTSYSSLRCNVQGTIDQIIVNSHSGFRPVRAVGFYLQ